ncbi:ABC transporter ATP-binding protein [Brumimicrobium oceani]|uniref:ABC transporter domain-containing protein n=1 Tax=Brumimicrobium oceani TaxID=2100725 RepID=A0A2U2XF07_9FLAO|nr:ABC transporter ATP-binding protein [Brumimicrobium oceani]PWH86320.1 hypothetical protein DIT68_03520 [Brumimicrobium oceani]
MILEVENIAYSYTNKNFVFKSVSFNLSPGEVISIVGPSGTGKSTLLKCIAGLIQLDEGKVLIEGSQVPEAKNMLIPGHPEVALVNQLFELDDYFTVRENISNQLHHLPLAERFEFTDELLDIFELEDLAHKKSKDISGGEQQRLSMACALAKEPRCLLLDEPFAHLDVHLNKKIGEYIRRLANLRQMGVVLVTHDGTEALAWSDRILVMSNGEVFSEYTPFQAYHEPKTFFEGSFFGELNKINLDGKQLLFRPTEYSLTPDHNKIEIQLEWKYSSFRGPYYANYFESKGGEEVVLYANKELIPTNVVYV